MAVVQTSIASDRDLYPSRTYPEPVKFSRQDPVVYSDSQKAAPLTKAQLAEYEEKGFLFLDDIFGPEELSSLIREMKSMCLDEAIKRRPETITEKGSGEVRSVFSVHQLNKVFAKVAEDPRLVAVAEYILGDSVYIHQSRLNCKPGFEGKEFYWHSDFETWHTEDGMPRMRALSMSITLTPNDHNNGPLLLIPGSHRSFISCVGETPKDHYLSSLKQQEFGIPDQSSVADLIEQGGIETAVGDIGRIILFDCNTLHGSNGNITPYPRSNLFFVYNALSNKVSQPFASNSIRPEFIGARHSIKPIKSVIFN